MQEWSLGGVIWPVIEAWWESYDGGRPARMRLRTPKLPNVVDLGEELRLEDEYGCHFLGYVFSVEDRGKDREIVAYDQMRYLMFKDTYLLEGKTADEILALLAKDMGLRLGQLDGTGVAMDLALVDKKLMDIVEQALAITREQSGREYVLWDDGGALRLTAAGALDSGILLSEDSALLDYARGESIDEDSYNRVKIAKKDKKKGERSVVVAEDGVSGGQWGVLQYYQRVDEKLSEGEMRAQARAILAAKNRSSHTLTLHSAGDARCRAGFGIAWTLDGETAEGRITWARHHWKGAEYTMALDVRV